MASETPFVKAQDESPPSPSSLPPDYSTIAQKEASQPRGPPPSYYDVVGQLKYDIGTAKEESNNPATMLFRICCICIGSLICSAIVFILFGAVPIALLVVGAVHLDDCDLDDRIPVWMVVYGSVSLAYSLVNIFKSVFCQTKRRQAGERAEEDKPSPMKRCVNSLEGLFNTFLFVWLIIGSVWVLGKYDDWDKADRPNCNGTSEDHEYCCHEGTFLFAFIFIIVMWSLLFLLICCACSCVCLLLACLGSKAGEQA